MALGTLGDLRSAVLITRSDLVGRFTDILALAEQRMYYGGDGVPPLRVRNLEATVDVAFVSGAASLPAGYLDKRALYWRGAVTVPVAYEPPDLFYGQEIARQSGSLPEAYTVEGSTIKITPSLTGTAKMLYHGMAATLAADNDTNAILSTFPGVYLYGCQVELARVTRDATQEQLALRRYADAVTAANAYAVVSRTFGGVLKRKVGFAI